MVIGYPALLPQDGGSWGREPGKDEAGAANCGSAVMKMWGMQT
jgi:hypothetical protein